MSVIVAFLFAISLWYLSSNHKVTSVKLKATYLKFLPNRGWHGLIPAGGTFVSATGGTFQSDTPGTFVSAMGGTFDSDIPGTFESATGGTFNPLLSGKGCGEDEVDLVMVCDEILDRGAGNGEGNGPKLVMADGKGAQVWQGEYVVWDAGNVVVGEVQDS